MFDVFVSRNRKIHFKNVSRHSCSQFEIITLHSLLLYLIHSYVRTHAYFRPYIFLLSLFQHLFQTILTIEFFSRVCNGSCVHSTRDCLNQFHRSSLYRLLLYKEMLIRNADDFLVRCKCVCGLYALIIKKNEEIKKQKGKSFHVYIPFWGYRIHFSHR